MTDWRELEAERVANGEGVFPVSWRCTHQQPILVMPQRSHPALIAFPSRGRSNFGRIHHAWARNGTGGH